MTGKKYQPERTDFLINTDWGMPSDRLSAEEAKSRGKKLFHGRWVTKEERRQLREEHSTYQSIQIIGGLLIVLTLPLWIHIGKICEGGFGKTFLAVIFGAAMLATGIGLIRFRPFAGNMAIVVFLSFLVLPFTPLLSDDKGAPLVAIFGLTGLYYLLRRTARKIFAPPTEKNIEDAKPKKTIRRKVVYAILWFLALGGIYILYDMHQAKQMAVEACNRAVYGAPLEDFRATFSANDYKMIHRSGQLIIVPRKGMGRNHCIVFHDGQKIIEAKTGYND